MADDVSADRQLNDVTSAVRSLAEVMRANGLTKVDVEFGDLSIKLSAGGGREVTYSAPAPVPAASSDRNEQAPAQAGQLVSAPMIGTFYLSSGPGEPPFVRVGDHIEVGQTIGIIEAMKIMNEIPADRAGLVLEILVANAQPVEYGSPLLRVGSDEAPG